MQRCLIAAGVIGLLASAAFGQPTITVQPMECVPDEFNGLVAASVSPEQGGTLVRLFFRWDNQDFPNPYFTDMFADQGERYWGLTARPEAQNERVEYWVEVIDPGADPAEHPRGRSLARSETFFAPVTEDCAVRLTDRQFGAANNLVVGETVTTQEGDYVHGFLCDGVVTRVNHEGIMRPDEVCRGCVIPWWLKEEYIAPAVAIPPATLIFPPDEDDVSRDRP